MNTAFSRFDYNFLQSTTNSRTPLLNIIFKTISQLSKPVFLMLIALIVSIIWLIRTKKTWAPLLLLTSLAGSNLLTLIIKTVTKKERPEFGFMVPPLEPGFSFPSSHTLAIAVFCLTLGYLIYLTNLKDKTTFLINWILVTALCVLLVSLSRLYLGYHWIFDIIGSIGLSLIILVIIIFIDRYLKPKD